MANNQKYMGITLSALFGVAALLFFAVSYPHHLHFKEQCQLFLFTLGYFTKTVSIPGGLADYTGRFVTQFHYHCWAGAAILAALLVLVQRLVWALVKRVRLRWAFYPLTFLPSIALWASYCDANRTLSLSVACAACLLAARLYLCFDNVLCRLLFSALMMPILYWTVGGAYIAFVGLVVAFEGLRGAKDGAWLRWIVILAAAVALALLYPWAARTCVRYPLNRLILGINYHRTILEGLPAQFAVIILVVVVPFAFVFLPELKRKIAYYGVLGLELFLISAGGYYVVWLASDMRREEELAYDYYVRMADWEKILELADSKPPAAPLPVACLNLALAKTGCMGDKMFSYRQIGPEGLFSQPDMYYHLGMINASQRFAFDMMEAVDDFQRSGRRIKRLAEVNIINRQYNVAAKYLRLLQDTLFYRAWANENMALLECDDREDRINDHREYGWLRQMRERRDYLFPFEPTFNDTQRALAQLVRVNGKNRIAYEYLLASALLTRDLDRFLQFYPLGKDLKYDHIPACHQEALSFVWWQRHASLDGLPWPIDGAVLRRLQRFLDASLRNPGPQSRSSFGNTYWYYLYTRREQR